MPIKDIRNNIAIFFGKNVAISTNTTTEIFTYDMQDYGTGFAVGLGTTVYTDGTYVLKFEESDDNSTFTDVAASDLNGTIGTVTALTPDGAQLTEVIGYIGAKRYLKISVVSTNVSTGATALVVAIGSNQVKPVL